MGEGSGEDERGPIDLEDQVGLDEAADLFGIGGAERGGDGFLDGGEPDDDDGFGVSEGWWRVEAEVEALLIGKCDGRDVLVLGGVQTAEDAGQVDDGADVGAVGSTTSDGGVASGGDEVGVGAVGEEGDHALGMTVVEEGLISALGKAVVLHVDGTLEAVLVGFEVEGSGKQVGVFEERFGVGWGDAAYGGDVFLDAGLLEAGLGEILAGADEDSRAATDGFAEGGEVSAGLWSEKEDGLLGLVRDDDGDAFVGYVFTPGFDAGEPFVGGRVGVAAQEGDDEEVVYGLAGREIRMEPELVAGLEVRNIGDG